MRPLCAATQARACGGTELQWRVRRSTVLLVAAAVLCASSAHAWGDLGHRVTALIAYRHLTEGARSALDTMLAGDPDTLTEPDFASRAIWADKYRNYHRETAAWHFVDIEIDHPDLRAACYGFPQLTAHQTAAEGPAEDCIVNKIDEFAAELSNPRTPPAERLLALKFLIHFVGDLHQPLHSADHFDRGGNCVFLSPSPPAGETNLHAYWDIGTVDSLGSSADQIAAKLDARLTPDDLKAWSAGTPQSWAMESFDLARRDAYALSSLPTCRAHGSVDLPAAYQAEAKKDAAEQLLKAGIRMAGLLNRALGTAP
jgi:hypothetical protein